MVHPKATPHANGIGGEEGFVAGEKSDRPECVPFRIVYPISSPSFINDGGSA